MSDEPQQLPQRPNLRHLRDQAKDLLRSGGAASLTAAQYAIARRYGFPSWPKLKEHVDALTDDGRLSDALRELDLPRVQELARRNPSCLRGRPGSDPPLARVARRDDDPLRTAQRLQLAEWLIAHGATDGLRDGRALGNAAYHDDVAMAELLLRQGADPAARDPMICACEVICPRVLRCLLDHGAPPIIDAARMLLQTYMRNPAGKHAGLDALAAAGCPLPDTAALAVHRGRLDLLERLVGQDPSLLQRRLELLDIYPAALGGTDPGNGLHATPLAGGTLLHLAIEYDELDVARWLLAHGAAVDARALGDAGHSPLFHAVVTQGRKAEDAARLLLTHGADPNLRATVRKQLRYMGDRELERPRTYVGCTPISYARRWAVSRWVNEPAITAVAAAGGADDGGEVMVE
jgi:ankyrin repeat protein